MKNPFKRFESPSQHPGSRSSNKLIIVAGIVTFIIVVVVMFESVVIVQAGHRGVVLYVGAVENRVAQAAARSNVAKANGESQAIKIISVQLKQSPQYLQWLSINRWNGQLPYALGSGAVPFFQQPLRPPSQIQNQTQNQTQLR